MTPEDIDFGESLREGFLSSVYYPVSAVEGNAGKQLPRGKSEPCQKGRGAQDFSLELSRKSGTSQLTDS